MLGILGFIAAAVCIGAFAFTASYAYWTIPQRKLFFFATSFTLLATAMLVWAAALAIDTPSTTRMLIMTSDVLLVLATGCMIVTMFDRIAMWMIALLGLCGSLVIGERAYHYVSSAYINDGLLYFNLSTHDRGIVMIMFVGFWIPAIIGLMRYMRTDTLLASLRPVLLSSFVSLVLLEAAFLSARRTAVIITTFIMIILLFLAMTIANVCIIKLHRVAEGSHAAKRSK